MTVEDIPSPKHDCEQMSQSSKSKSPQSFSPKILCPEEASGESWKSFPTAEDVPRFAEPVTRVASEPISSVEKENMNIKMRKSNDVFDLDLVKRRDRRPKASVYMMEKKGRDRVRKAVLNVLLFPLHLGWWRRRVPASRPYLYRLSILYLLHALSLVRELFRKPDETPVEFVELMMPFLLLIVMAILMGQVAASAMAPVDTGLAPSPILNAATASEKGAMTPKSLPARNEIPIREKVRKLRRRASKSESNNDSTNEMLTNEDEDEDGTGSSADSDSSDSPSDSSSDEQQKTSHYRPHVAVRRSSLLGTSGNPLVGNPSSPQNKGISVTAANESRSGNAALNSQGAYQTRPNGVTTMNGQANKNGTSSTTHQKASTVNSPPQVPVNPSSSPTNQSTISSRTGRKPRIFFPRIRGHTSDVVSNIKPEGAAVIREEADSDTDEEDEARQFDVNDLDTSDLPQGQGDGSRGLGRNRLMSQSMDDLLESVKSVHWSVHGPEKVFLTHGQIRAELERKIFEVRMSESYRHFAFAGAIIVALIPVMFRGWLFGTALYCRFVSLPIVTEVLTIPPGCESCSADQTSVWDEACAFIANVFGTSAFDFLGILTSAIASFTLSWILLGHVAGAVETFKRRYMYAKYFSKLTSSRKARRAGLPYFHLHKVDHIKVWLSLRSRRTDLDRECIGPYRASDSIAHFLFMVAIFLVGVVAFRAVQNVSGTGKPGSGSGAMLSTIADWVLVGWATILAIYVQRIMALASKTHEKFQNTSVLLTEELNIHMRLLRKPEKKDELNACNQMLKVASALIKELEGGKAKKGQNGALVLDPWLYSIVRVVLLSALGALSSDLFGFRVRLWKI